MRNEKSGAWTEWKTTRKTEGNPGWKGETATIGSIHCWVRRNWGKLSECEICGKERSKGGAFDWSNKDHKYSRLREDWQYVCRSCHNLYDQEHNGRDLKSRDRYEWSLNYEHCIDCGRNDVKYKSAGRCSRCYLVYRGQYDAFLEKRRLDYKVKKLRALKKI